MNNFFKKNQIVKHDLKNNITLITLFGVLYLGTAILLGSIIVSQNMDGLYIFGYIRKENSMEGYGTPFMILFASPLIFTFFGLFIIVFISLTFV